MKSWPITWPETGPHTTATDQQRELAELYAVSSLRMLTLYQVGGDPVTVRPHTRGCRNFLAPDAYGPGFHPVLTDSGQYGNCFCGSGCGCGSSEYVNLTAPVGGVVEVRVDGQVLPDDTYELIDGHKLVRTDGRGWPSCSPGFTVTYISGRAVDRAGQYAALILAQEFLRAITGSGKCKLPSSVTNLARAGVTMEMRPGMFAKGLTGINEVDAWLMQWNPNGLRVKPQVYSPDLKRNAVIRGGW